MDDKNNTPQYEVIDVLDYEIYPDELTDQDRFFLRVGCAIVLMGAAIMCTGIFFLVRWIL